MNGMGAINGSAINVSALNVGFVLVFADLIDTVSLVDDEAVFDLYISGRLTGKVVACHGGNTPADARPPKGRYVPVCRRRD